MNYNFIFLTLFVLVVCRNGVIHDVNAEFHNCVTAVPEKFPSQNYRYIPCDVPQQNSDGFLKTNGDNSIRSLPTPVTPQIQNNPIVTHTEVQHYIISEDKTEIPQQSTGQINTTSNYNYVLILIVGIIIFVIVVTIIAVVRRSERQTLNYRMTSTYSPSSTSARITRRVDGNTITETTVEEKRSVVGWDEPTWELVKKNHPKDWEKFLKWVATHKEDIEVIKRNSKDFQEVLYKALEKAKQEGFGDDMK